MKKIKQFIVRWAIKQIKNLGDENYDTLGKWGIADISINEKTGEQMFIFD